MLSGVQRVALTVTSPASGARVGPGYSVTVNISAGPIPNDDYVSVTVRVHSTAHSLDQGSIVTAGSLNPVVIIGEDLLFPLTRHELAYDVAPGASVDLVVVQWHASGALVDAAVLGAWLWDPTGGVYVLIERAGDNGGGILGKIFAAVSKTMPSLP